MLYAFFALVATYIAVLINLVFHLAHLYGFFWMGVGIAVFVFISLTVMSLIFRKQVKNFIRMLNQ